MNSSTALFVRLADQVGANGVIVINPDVAKDKEFYFLGAATYAVIRATGWDSLVLALTKHRCQDFVGVFSNGSYVFRSQSIWHFRHP